MELTSLVSASQQGDLKAYTKLIRQTQHLALGYALSLLDDHARAQDVVQDAYLTAPLVAALTQCCSPSSQET